jgi:transcriptional regulator with XRE-family HTH domain
MGITQEKLAEMARVSTHYIAMIETCKKYPKPEMLEHIAQTLKIEPYKLFSVESDPNESFERFHQSIVSEMKQMAINIKQDMIEAVVKAIDSRYKQ